jgi:hypothetical protein
MLLVREVAVVVNHLEGVALFAVLTEVGLENAPTRDKLLLGVAALMAFEKGLLHLRNDIRVPNDDTLDRDQLIDMRGI